MNNIFVQVSLHRPPCDSPEARARAGQASLTALTPVRLLQSDLVARVGLVKLFSDSIIGQHTKFTFHHTRYVYLPQQKPTPKRCATLYSKSSLKPTSASDLFNWLVFRKEPTLRPLRFQALGLQIHPSPRPPTCQVRQGYKWAPSRGGDLGHLRLT